MPAKKKEKKEKKEKKSTMIEDAKPAAKKQEAPKKDANEKLINKPEKATREEIDNTNAWAQADATHEKDANKEADQL